MTIREAGKNLREELTKIYDQGEAASISDWVMEYLTGIRKTDRITKWETALTTEQQSRLSEITSRLLTHEPVQYVLNEAWFCGLKFFVDSRVLIPRPETEELVEWVITNCKFPIESLKILDIGTGSGCIPISLKRRLGKAELWAIDLSEDALAVATQNAKQLGANVNFLAIDFLNPQERKSLPSFDIITCNPPYIPLSEKQNMAGNVTDFEPHLALFVTNDDPLIFYHHLAEFGKTNLNANGQIYAEIYEEAGKEIVELFSKENYKVELKKDLSGKTRLVRASLAN